MATKWKLEDDVNDYVKSTLEALGLKKLVDYNVESGMSDYMKEALKGSAKTKNKKLCCEWCRLLCTKYDCI